jgi:SAM-dependent methyltransferase
MQLQPVGDVMHDGSVTTSDFSSAAYWEGRYRVGGNSGAGSYGRLAAFKAAFVNAFVELNDVRSVIEFGCGDGNQLSLLSIPQYTGVDVSATVLARCRARFPNHVFVDPTGLADVPAASLGLSMDVIFHLTEDAVFADYMRALFGLSADYVIIYSSDCDARAPDRHVKHRLVSDYIRRVLPGWALLARVPNIYPFDARQPHDTSFSDFMVFGRGRRDCHLLIPAAMPAR